MSLITRGVSETQDAPGQAESTRRGTRWGRCIALVVVLGLLVRLGHTLSSGFPLHDGGLFLVMMQDLQDAHYSLPAFTSYNGGDIPFAYPPLGLYVGAILEAVTPLSYLDVLRFVPLVVSALTVGAFVLFARAYLRSDVERFGAVSTFALLPGAFVWWIMGGGLTRSFGFFFAVLAIWQLYMLLTTRNRS